MKVISFYILNNKFKNLTSVNKKGGILAKPTQ